MSLHEVLEWLFAVPARDWLRGELTIDWPWWGFALGVGLLALVVLLPLGYRRLRNLTRGRRVVLGALRLALLTVLAFALLRPALVVDVEEPVRGHVAVLVDDSRSMRAGRGSPAASAAAAFTPPGGALAVQLSERFDTRFYRFGAGLEPLDAAATPTYDAGRSDLGAALARLAGGAGIDTLAGIVVVSDGALEVPAQDDSAVLRLRAAGVPVHVVTLAGARASDVAIADFELPRGLLIDAAVDARIALRHAGEVARSVAVVIEVDGRIVDQFDTQVPAGTGRIDVERRLRFERGGVRRVVARLEAPDDISDNDRLARSVRVQAEPLRVLHYEGEPRFEVKFARRALRGDDALRLTSLVRTAENKHLRLGIESVDELRDGFPSTAEELFRYHAVVIGSVPERLLSPEQARALEAFVSRRGGGLLLLGGRHAFAEGGHARGPLAALAPVLIEGRGTPGFSRALRPRATAAGRLDPLLELSDDTGIDALLERLPPLQIVNPLRRAKPGARVLLTAPDGTGEPLVVLAEQRYGRGTVASLAVRNTWRWQMHADVPPEDMSHERLWRQLLRSLARAAPARVTLNTSAAEAVVGDVVELDVEALDATYRPATEMPRVQVTTPLGELLEPTLTQTAPGQFSAQLVAAESGRYEIESVPGDASDTEVAPTHALLDVSADGAEFRHLGARGPALAALGAATGGAQLSAPEDVLDVLDDVRESRRVRERVSLGQAPILLLLALALASAEWLLRRRWGAA